MSWICITRRARLSFSKPSAFIAFTAAGFNRISSHVCSFDLQLPSTSLILFHNPGLC